MAEELLLGRVALVVGAERERSIGRSIARRLSALGAQVAVTGTPALTPADDPDGWRGAASVSADLERSSRRSSSWHVVDVADELAVDELVGRVVELHGRLDIVAYTAAVPAGDARPITELETSTWNATVAVNLTGAMFVGRAATRQMLAQGDGGRVIAIGSVHGREGVAHRAAYSATKFGLVGLMQSMAQELAPAGITVNTVCPGVVATDRLAGAKAEVLNALISKIPAGRTATPEDIADLVAHLCTPGAGYITGQCINVDGGWQMR